jgi:hypothetical protein
MNASKSAYLMNGVFFAAMAEKKEEPMILISCRKNFADSRVFAEQNAVRNYPFLPDLDRFDELDVVNLAAQMRGKHVLIIIHGF